MKQDLEDLACKIDMEGFGYYMMEYGPNLDLIEKLGFDKQEVQKAIDLFIKIEAQIMEHAGEIE